MTSYVISAKRANQIDRAGSRKRLREQNMIEYGRAKGPTKAQVAAAIRRLLSTEQVDPMMRRYLEGK